MTYDFLYSSITDYRIDCYRGSHVLSDLVDAFLEDKISKNELKELHELFWEEYKSEQ